ncbi:hypothetical protein RB213_004200, partial [Colletotrichum asianum]
ACLTGTWLLLAVLVVPSNPVSPSAQPTHFRVSALHQSPFFSHALPSPLSTRASRRPAGPILSSLPVQCFWSSLVSSLCCFCSFAATAGPPVTLSLHTSTSSSWFHPILSLISSTHTHGHTHTHTSFSLSLHHLRPLSSYPPPFSPSLPSLSLWPTPLLPPLKLTGACFCSPRTPASYRVWSSDPLPTQLSHQHRDEYLPTALSTPVDDLQK